MKTTFLKVLPVIMIMGISVTGVQCQQKQSNEAEIPPHTMPMTAKLGQMPEGKVETSFVCFVNNKYLGKEQIPVEVDGKTYYGCCMGCVGNLKKNRAPRYSVDPLSGKEVDLSTAYIVLRPDGSGEVLYFESEENYQKYSSEKRTDN